MKIGDLVNYKTPFGKQDASPLAIVVGVDEDKETVHIRWIDNNQTDIMPTKWLEIVQPSKSETS